MERLRIIFVVSLFLFSFFYLTDVGLGGEEIIMEESPSPATSSSAVSATTSPSKPVTAPSAKLKTPVQQKRQQEEIFEEGGGGEEKPVAPKTPQEKELTQVPPSGPLQEEFQEEEEGQVVVTDQELQNLENKINQLRNQILDTKSKIMELGDRISQGFISGTKLNLIFTNGMGGSFVPVKAVVKLDGYPIYQEDNKKKLSDSKGLKIFSASILPENHRIDVDLMIEGKGYGIFTYMKAVKMEISATYYFSAPRGRTFTIEIIPYDRGTIYQLKDRPSIKFEIVK